MNKSSVSVEMIKNMQASGQLQEAEAACVEWLKSHPQDIEMLHLLALLYAQSEKLPEAQALLEKALKIAPNHPAICLHLANKR
jgi:Flp pilus assembly protein TadD